MDRKGMLYLSIALLFGLFSLWGCPKKSEVTTVPEAQTQTEKATTPAAATETKAEETKAERKAGVANETAGTGAEALTSVYFDFDKSAIRADAKEAMKTNAEWLKANPKAKIRIEGNCDERGTAEYNQGLGRRRAASAKKYLAHLGVSSHRITLISYGKEKPLCAENTEACWQKNRRDDFVVMHE